MGSTSTIPSITSSNNDIRPSLLREVSGKSVSGPTDVMQQKQSLRMKPTVKRIESILLTAADGMSSKISLLKNLDWPGVAPLLRLDDYCSLSHQRQLAQK